MRSWPGHTIDRFLGLKRRISALILIRGNGSREIGLVLKDLLGDTGAGLSGADGIG